MASSNTGSLSKTYIKAAPKYLIKKSGFPHGTPDILKRASSLIPLVYSIYQVLQCVKNDNVPL